MSHKQKIWGWGWEEVKPSAKLVSYSAAIAKSLGITADHANTPLDLGDIAKNLRPPRVKLPHDIASFCTENNFDRMRHSYGQSFRDIVRCARGEFGNPPEYVAYPRKEADIVRLMAWAESNNVFLIPRGGGTSVVGGVTPCDKFMYISVNIRDLNKILHVDKISQLVRVEAGILGPELNKQLKAHGLTLRHFPQSWEFSTVGGWVSTHSGGHYSTIETHINEFVESLKIVTPAGIISTNEHPFSGAGPISNHLFFGSEGILGIITEVTLRVQQTIKYKVGATVNFSSFLEGVEAVREISQCRLHPSVCRIFDDTESNITGLSPEGKTTLLLEFESPTVPNLDQSLQSALEICKKNSGTWTNKEMTKNDSKKGQNTEAWRDNFLGMPYLRETHVLNGIISETFETSCRWDNFSQLHSDVIKAFYEALQSFGGRGSITCRFTHVYPDGPAPYFTVFAVGTPKKQLEEWDIIKNRVSNVLLSHDATITHHHAVGRDHQPFFGRERNPLFMNVLRSVKKTLDPNGIMNPGVLLEAPSKL